MNYSLSGWSRESPEVPRVKKEVVGPFFHILHYIDILQRDKVQQGTCGQGQQLCRKKAPDNALWCRFAGTFGQV